MPTAYLDGLEARRESVPEWVHLGLRLVLVALVAKPALSKVVTYGRSVAFFDAIGMPVPAAMVVVAGVVELGAIGLLLVGVWERLAAASLIPVMLVAMLYVGVDWKNLGVLAATIGVVTLNTNLTGFRSTGSTPG